jgi:hypothetical protein
VRLAALLLLAACGRPLPHEPYPIVDAPPAPQPTGAHYHYVVNRVLLPTTATEAVAYGYDLDGDGIKNAAGTGIAALASAGFDVQGVMDRVVADGSIVMLIDLQTDDLANSVGLAGLRIFQGTQPQPSPCAGSADTVCGHHLDGTGSFQTVATIPLAPYGVLEGGVISGAFTGSGDDGPSIEIALVGEVPIDIFLRRMHFVASAFTATTIDDATIAGVFDGASWNDDFGGGLVGAVAYEARTLVALDCSMLDSPPGCGCAAGSLGQQILAYFDTNPRDCRPSLNEISATPFADLTYDTRWAGGAGLSFGIKVTAVKAAFDEPVTTP